MISKETFAFLNDLAANNNKAWFDANRPRYERVRADFIDSVAEFIRELGSRMPLSHIQPKDCIFRINRDVRFSKDKSPYKLNFSCAISPQGKKDMMPEGIYIHIQPNECFLGMGMYELSSDQLKAVRQEIDYNLDAWKAIVEAPEFVKTFGEVRGERLKTMPKGYATDNPAIHWLRLQQFYVSGHFPDKEAQSEGLPERIGKAFDVSADFRQFLKDATASV